VLAVETEQLCITADEDTAAARRFGHRGARTEQAVGAERDVVANRGAKPEEAAFADNCITAHDALGGKPAMVVDAGMMPDHSSAPQRDAVAQPTAGFYADIVQDDAVLAQFQPVTGEGTRADIALEPVAFGLGLGELGGGARYSARGIRLPPTCRSDWVGNVARPPRRLRRACYENVLVGGIQAESQVKRDDIEGAVEGDVSIDHICDLPRAIDHYLRHLPGPLSRSSKHHATIDLDRTTGQEVVLDGKK